MKPRYFFYSLITSLLAAAPALADTCSSSSLDQSSATGSQAIPNCVLTHPTQIRIVGTDITTLINNLLSNTISIIYVLIAGAAVLLVIYGGILYITSAGNPDKIKQGRQAIFNAMGAVILVVAAYFILRLILSVVRVIVPSF